MICFGVIYFTENNVRFLKSKYRNDHANFLKEIWMYGKNELSRNNAHQFAGWV